MKRILLASALAVGNLLFAQQKDNQKNPVYLKANAVFLPVGMLNAAVEMQISDKMTLQPEVFISPWKSFMGKYAQMYLAGMDTRYYFNEAFKHFYVGANVSAARFKVQKFNYWSDGPYQYTETSPIYVTSDLYQDGYSVVVGAVAGYQWQVSSNWNLDLFVGAGSAQSFYKGYHKVFGVRYDTEPDREWNRSGEFLPYRGGLMISYKLR